MQYLEHTYAKEIIIKNNVSVIYIKPNFTILPYEYRPFFATHLQVNTSSFPSHPSLVCVTSPVGSHVPLCLLVLQNLLHYLQFPVYFSSSSIRRFIPPT